MSKTKQGDVAVSRRLTDLDYLKLNRWQKFLYKLKMFFCGIPGWFVRLFKKIGRGFKRFGLYVKDSAVDIWTTFVKGSWKTKVSYLIMGFANLARGQILRGLIFLLMEAAFIVYMVLAGGHWLAMFFSPHLGYEATKEVWDPVY